MKSENPGNADTLLRGGCHNTGTGHTHPLLTEAVLRAREAKVGKTSTNVFRPEHLAAIMIQTGRPKDREMLLLLREQAGLDRRMLRRILIRHGLWEKWERFVAGIPGS